MSDIVLVNNLFRGGTLYLDDYNQTCTLKDNLFDQTSFIVSDTNYLVNGNNGYVTNCDRLTNTFGTDVILASSPAYQIGSLGRWYYPTNLILTNAGSQTADLASLYHYTTTTNQVNETNSIVDIGFHYVAVGTNGLPFDTNGDGVPDYLEDANGNGITDAGVTFLNFDAYALGMVINEIQVYKPLQ